MAGRGRSKKGGEHSADTQDPGEGGENILAASLAIAQGQENFCDMLAKRDEENEERRLKAQYEAEERAEQRRIKAEIAAEERAEQRRERAELAAEERREKAKAAEEERREKAKIAEEERLEARALLKEKRRMEEAIRLEEANEKRDEAAREAAKEEFEQRKAEALRAEEASRELMAAQAELGRKASEAHRLEIEKAKVISGLSTLQRDEDVEDFLLAQERKLRAGGIPEVEWAAQIGSKLTGQVGNNWQERREDGLDYQSLRVACLKGCGYTPDLAGDEFFSFRYEHLKGLAGEQVYTKGAQLLKRMVAPTVLDPEAVFKIVKRWVYNCVGRRARAVLEAREIEGVEALARGLQDFLSHEGEKVPGKAAVFGGDHFNPRKQAYHSDPDKERRKAGNVGSSGSSNYQGVGKCFKCGKPGHKAADCWGSAGKPVEGSNKIICYICGIEGHKATTCPSKKEAQEGTNTKQVKRLEVVESLDNLVEGRINGRKAKLLLDTGAQITVVPENLVGEELKTGEYVKVKGVLTSGVMPLAKVEFEVEGMEKWKEEVALAPAEEGKENEVLYGLRLKSLRGPHLVALVKMQEGAEVGVKRVRRVTTQVEEKEEEVGRQEKAKLVEVEKPKVQAVVTECRKEVEAEVETAEIPSPSPAKQQEEVSMVTECRKEVEAEVETAEVPSPSPVKHQKEVSNLEPVAQTIKTAEGVFLKSEVSLKEEIEDGCQKRDDGPVDLVLPLAKEGPDDRAKLVEKARRNPNLKEGRRVATKDSCIADVKVPRRKPVAEGAAVTVRKTAKAAKPKRQKQRKIAELEPNSFSIGVVSERSPGRGGMVEDRPARKPQTVLQGAATTRQDAAVVESKDEWPDWAGMTYTEKGGMEPGISDITDGEEEKVAEWVSEKLARVADEEPKPERKVEVTEKQLSKIVIGGDHAKEDEAADKVSREAGAVIEERGSRGSTASGKCVDFLQSSAVDSLVDNPNRKKDEKTVVRLKVRLKPVKALEVALRASALEQARLEKIAKASRKDSKLDEGFELDEKFEWDERFEEKDEKSELNEKFEWDERFKEKDEKFELDEKFKLEDSEVTSDEVRVEDLGGIKDDAFVKLREESLKLKEKCLSRRKKKFDREPTVTSSLSSVPTPSVVCWTAGGLEAFTGLRVSGVDVNLHVISTQDWASKVGDPKHRAMDNRRERPIVTKQQQSDGEGNTRFGDSRQQEIREVSTSFGDPRQLEAGEGRSERSGVSWLQSEQGVGDKPGLRTALFCVVGGDVGPEVPTEVRSGYSWCSPPRKMHKRCRKKCRRKKGAAGDETPESPQISGGATSGVALQGPAEQQQQASDRVQTVEGGCVQKSPDEL